MHISPGLRRSHTYLSRRGSGGLAGVLGEARGTRPRPVAVAAAVAVTGARFLQLEEGVAGHDLAPGVARAARAGARSRRCVRLARVDGALARAVPGAVAVADAAPVLGAAVLHVEVGVAFESVECVGHFEFVGW